MEEFWKNFGRIVPRTEIRNKKSPAATEFDASQLATSSSPFYGCKNLVGGTDMFVPTNSTAVTALKLGAGGVLTNPDDDKREWFYYHLYSDGDLVLTTTETA